MLARSLTEALRRSSDEWAAVSGRAVLPRRLTPEGGAPSLFGRMDGRAASGVDRAVFLHRLRRRSCAFRTDGSRDDGHRSWAHVRQFAEILFLMHGHGVNGPVRAAVLLLEAASGASFQATAQPSGFTFRAVRRRSTRGRGGVRARRGFARGGVRSFGAAAAGRGAAVRRAAARWRPARAGAARPLAAAAAAALGARRRCRGRTGPR